MLLLSVLALLNLPVPGLTHASTNKLGTIIESFVARHFSDAISHLWVVNSTQWNGDEIVVDVHTVVVENKLPVPIENRYLLLIKEGKLAAAQRIPLRDGADCRREET